MRYLVVALIVASLMLLSGLSLTSASGISSVTSFDDYNSTTNGISNFTVHVNSQTVDVFKYVNVTGTSSSLTQPYVNDESVISLFWQGLSNVTITPAISFSSVGNFSYSSSVLEYVYFYQSNYLGTLFTTGKISESANQLSISGSSFLQHFAISYMSAPISNFNFSQNSMQFNGYSFIGNYSSFGYANGEIKDYSLINQDSSVAIISNISSSESTLLSFSTKDFSVPGSTCILASDGLFPTMYLQGYDSSINITLSDGFSFGNSDRESLQVVNSNYDPSPHSIIPFYEEHILKINRGAETLGYVDIYGRVSIVNSTLEVNSPISFVLIRFLPSFHSTNGQPNNSNGHLGNASTEIFINNQAYFVPFSPNVTSQNLSFERGVLDFQFIQNSSQKFVIVIQGNYSVSSFSLKGVGSNGGNFTVTRTANETIISFTTNGTGQGTLSLSVVPFVGTFSKIPLIGLMVSTSALVIVVGSLIIYSRKRWIEKLEKE